MILPRREDAIHKMQLYRLLTALLDDSKTSQFIIFKGGTCAMMLGFLDRFSIDLDFDLKRGTDKKLLDKRMRNLFAEFDFSVKEKSRNELFYLLKYPSEKGMRNTVKLSIMSHLSRYDEAKPYYLSEIDRYAVCQTIETMFSHKLVALSDRFRKHRMIAGRDLYDIHHFFMKGYGYIGKIIEDRTGISPKQYFIKLRDFIDKHITETVISEDLNFLLPPDKFLKIRKHLKPETLRFINDEIERIR